MFLKEDQYNVRLSKTKLLSLEMRRLRRAILRYSFCRGRDILDIHPSITLSILLVEHSCCTYMEAVTLFVSMCDQHFFVNNFNWLIYP